MITVATVLEFNRGILTPIVETIFQDSINRKFKGAEFILNRNNYNRLHFNPYIFTITFDKLNASLRNKSLNFLKKKSRLMHIRGNNCAPTFKISRGIFATLPKSLVNF